MKMISRIYVVLLGLISFTSSGFANDIKVGVSLSLSGPNASLGIPESQGLKAAIDYQSRIDGRKVQVIVLDDRSDASVSSRNARKLVEEGADVLIGSAGVPNTLAMAQVARESKVPMISLSPLPNIFTADPWLVNVVQPAKLMVDGVVDHMRRNGVKTVGYIGFSDAFSDLIYNALLESAQTAEIVVQSNERYARADSSVTGQVLKMMLKRPDAILVGASGTPGALPFLALSDRGYKGKLYGQHALVSADFLRVAGRSADGAIFPSSPVLVAEQLSESNPAKSISLVFRDHFKRANNAEPLDAMSPVGFDGWLIFIAASKSAIKAADPGTSAFREALRESLLNLKEVIGSQGVYSYTPASADGMDPRSRVLVRLEDKRWRLIE